MERRQQTHSQASGHCGWRGLEFLFEPRAGGKAGYVFSKSLAAYQFFRDSHGYGLECALNDRFEKTRVFLYALGAHIETLPFGRDSHVLKEKIKKDIRITGNRIDERDRKRIEFLRAQTPKENGLPAIVKRPTRLR